LNHEVWQVMQLLKETRGRLDWIRRRRVSTGQGRAPQMSDAFKPRSDAAGKNLAAPDVVVVTVSSAIKAHGDYTLVPRADSADRKLRASNLHRPANPEIHEQSVCAAVGW
jgi:hypothetical protein